MNEYVASIVTTCWEPEMDRAQATLRQGSKFCLLLPPGGCGSPHRHKRGIARGLARGSSSADPLVAVHRLWVLLECVCSTFNERVSSQRCCQIVVDTDARLIAASFLVLFSQLYAANDAGLIQSFDVACKIASTAGVWR